MSITQNVADSELSEELIELASHFRIAVKYQNYRHQLTTVSKETIEALLAVFGVDATRSDSARQALADIQKSTWLKVLPDYLAARQGKAVDFVVHAEANSAPNIWVELENGVIRHDVIEQPPQVPPQWIDGKQIEQFLFRLPLDLPTGYHTIFADCHAKITHCALIISPAQLSLREFEHRRGWGFALQLYSVRSRNSWGIGDCVDLAEFADLSAREYGADFVLINPIYAAEPTIPTEPSPYLPTTRRFANPLYLRIEAIPEFSYLSAARRQEIEKLADSCRQRNYSAELLDRDSTLSAKLTALEILRQVPRSPVREANFQAFRESQGKSLVDFATWCVLAEKYGTDWRQWPLDLQHPDSPAVAEERAAAFDRVDFYCYVQWLLDEQIASAADRAKRSGMSMGIMHDLPIGAHHHGADSWALADLLATGVAVGAPPDDLNSQGQDWSQPPWRPDRLAATGFSAWRDTVSRAFRHAGAVRVDHILGAFRQWWVPSGMSARDGAYVYLDHEALLGILALEADRAGAILIGEDLGVFESEVVEVLKERRIPGSNVLWFEQDKNGRPPLPESRRELTLATVGVHDLPPALGFLETAHVKLQHKLGRLNRPEAEAVAATQSVIANWVSFLIDHGYCINDPSEHDIVLALHRYIAATPAKFVAVMLTDAVGDRRIQNQPGTHHEYPNWRLPLCDSAGSPVLLEDLLGLDHMRRLASIMADRPLTGLFSAAEPKR